MQYGEKRKPTVPPIALPSIMDMAFIMVISRMSKFMRKNSALMINARSGLANSNKVAPSTTAKAVIKISIPYLIALLFLNPLF